MEACASEKDGGLDEEILQIPFYKKISEDVEIRHKLHCDQAAFQTFLMIITYLNKKVMNSRPPK